MPPNENPTEVVIEKLSELSKTISQISRMIEKSVKLIQQIADKPPKEKK